MIELLLWILIVIIVDFFIWFASISNEQYSKYRKGVQDNDNDVTYVTGVIMRDGKLVIKRSYKPSATKLLFYKD